MRNTILTVALFLILFTRANAADQPITFNALHFKVLKPSVMQMVVGLLSGDQVTTWTTSAMEYSFVYNVAHKDCGFGVIFTVDRDCAFEELSSDTVMAMFPATIQIKSSGYRANPKGAKYFLIEAQDTANGSLVYQAVFDHKAINKFLIVNTIFPGTNFTPRGMCETAAEARSINLKHWKSFVASVALDKVVGGQ